MQGEAGGNWVYQARGAVNRIEACFSGAAFSPHRHDTYAIGVTLGGVQSFDYRGAARHSLPGGVVVLHPDETHDGRAGTDASFRYRTIYIEPSLIQSALAGRPLPFIESGISSDERLYGAVAPLLEDYDRPLETLEFQDAVYDLAIALNSAAGGVSAARSVDYAAAERARQRIHDQLDEGISLADLERIAGHDRWALSRDFRALFGTSPYRYLIMRRLERAREMMLEGLPIADIAAACGFSDQSHFTRQFRKAYGMPPRKWQTAIMAAASERTIVL